MKANIRRQIDSTIYTTPGENDTNLEGGKFNMKTDPEASKSQYCETKGKQRKWLCLQRHQGDMQLYCIIRTLNLIQKMSRKYAFEDTCKNWDMKQFLLTLNLEPVW